MIIDKDERLKTAINKTFDATMELWVALEGAVHGFVRDCRDQRTQRRQVIAQEHHKKQTFSHAVLLYRLLRGNIELSWSRIWYVRGSNNPRYKRIPCAKSATHLTRLKSGAHKDEVELILLHEAKARAYREFNRRVRALMRDIDRFRDRYQLLTGGDVESNPGQQDWDQGNAD